ncbi:MAG TPA: helix-turn-helix domain-containing protein [Acidimicrobiales bacterium]|nr:helix-turn-helix domain-containing protein [Acidimicrobiales bacterium]
MPNQTRLRLARLRRSATPSDQGQSAEPPETSATVGTRRRQRRLTYSEVSAIKTAADAGLMVSEIARHYHVHHSTISDHLNRPPRARRSPALDEPMLNLAIKLYVSGLSFTAVGRELGIHAATVREYLIKACVQPRDRR